jgi:hypothetical protein
MLLPGRRARYLNSVSAAEPAQFLSSVLLLELSSCYASAAGYMSTAQTPWSGGA